MHVEIRLPDLGVESAQPPVLSIWLAEVGENVYEGDRIVEVLVAGATFDVSSPATGKLAEIHSITGDVLQPGHLLGAVEAEEESRVDNG